MDLAMSWAGEGTRPSSGQSRSKPGLSRPSASGSWRAGPFNATDPAPVQGHPCCQRILSPSSVQQTRMEFPLCQAPSSVQRTMAPEALGPQQHGAAQNPRLSASPALRSPHGPLSGNLNVQICSVNAPETSVTPLQRKAHRRWGRHHDTTQRAARRRGFAGRDCRQAWARGSRTAGKPSGDPEGHPPEGSRARASWPKTAVRSRTGRA